MSLFDPSILSMANTPAAPVAPVYTGLGDDAWLAASRALAAVAHPARMVRPFLPWQSAAYLYAQDSIARWSGTLIGDDMGMGKTQVLLALAADAVAKAPGSYVIVVSPTVAETGYRQDLAASFPHLAMHTVRGRTVSALPAADIYFISDDALTLKAWLGVEGEVNGKRTVTAATAWATGAAMVIRDEIHRDKGNMGKPSVRSKVMMVVGEAMRAAGRCVVGATGTLLTNRPVEAFIPLQIVGGERLVKALTPGANKASAFLWRYCAPVQKSIGGGRTAMDFRGQDTKAAHTLHEYLRRTVYVRREKSDLGEGVLPNSGYNVVPFALDSSVTVRYRRVEKELYDLITEEQGPAAAMRAERFLVIRQMMMMWEEGGKASAAASVEYVKTLTDEGEQVVLFFHHTSVRDAAMTALIKSNISFNVIDGKVTDKVDKQGNVILAARTEAIKEFQAGEVSVCLAQINAAGMAVTLTAAKHACFLQLPWSAGSLKQACDRILRVDDITRARAANGEVITWHVVQGCYANGDPMFSAAMWDVLNKKCHIVDAVNAGRPITITDDNVTLAMLETWMPNAKRHGGW